MVAITTCFTRHLTARVRVSNIGSPFGANYVAILTIPSAFLPTGHDFVFIVTGLAGNHILGAGSPSYCEIVPHFGPLGAGTTQTAQQYRQIFSFAPYMSQVGGPIPQPETQTGQPFMQMVRATTWAAATDFHVAARVFIDGSPFGVGASFDVEGLAIQVWDTTNLNTAGSWWEWRENLTEVDLPSSSAAPMLLQNFTRAHGTSVNWFVATYANITPKKEDEAAMFWADDGAGGEHFVRRVKPFLHGLPPGGRYDWQSQPLGMLRTTTLPATWTMRTFAQDNYTAGLRSRHHHSATFVVEMVAGNYLEGPSSNPTLGFWGTEDPWNGDAKELQKTTYPYYINGIVMAMVATAPIAGRWRTLLEADGAPVSSNNPLAVLSIADPRESLPQVRVVTYAFSGGKHWLTFRGNQHWGDPEPPFFKYDGFDVHLFGLNGVLGVIPPADVFEGPGPESAVLASKETAVSVSALPALPFQPSFGGTVATEGVTREMRTGSGYDITHPQFEKARRTVRLSWAALIEADALTLVSWAKDLAATAGAFRWKMVGDLSERPYSIVEATINEVDLGSGGPRSVSFDAVELLFYVP